MSLLELAQYIEALPSSTALRESVWGYTIVETSHVVSMCFFLAFLVMMDLRMAGVAFRGTPFSLLQQRFFKGQMFGFGLSSVTGGILVYQEPTRFYGNIFFWIKMVLLVLAGINAMVFHYTVYRRVDRWDLDEVPPTSARFAGFTSLGLWAFIIISGRLIAYNWFD